VRSCLEYRAAVGVISSALKGLPLLTLVLLLHGLVPADTPLFPPETGLIDQQHRDWRCYVCGMIIDLNLNCRHSALNSREALHLDRVGIHVIIFAQHRVSGSSGQVRSLISPSGHPLFSVVKFPFDHSGPALLKRNDDVLKWGAVLSSQEGFPPIWMSPFDVQESPNESGHDVGFGYLGKFHHGIAAGGCLFKRLPDIETASGPTVEARNRYGKLPVVSDLASKRGRNARVIFIEQAVGGHNRPIIRAVNRDHRGSVLHYCWGRKNNPQYIRRNDRRPRTLYSEGTDTVEDVSRQDIDVSWDGEKWFHLFGSECIKHEKPLDQICPPLRSEPPGGVLILRWPQGGV
jgi:hypothetical protein